VNFSAKLGPENEQFASLTPLEPRLSKKLVEPLSHLLTTTRATSLLYECISTITSGMADQVNLLKVCAEKLKRFLEDPDQNRECPISG
jgi:AP-3 complex subunit delta-1